MKLKRFLALAVSLAMVLSIVPAFSLTASAESIGDVITVDGIDYEVISENLYTNGDFEEGIDGWQTYNGSTLAAANGTDIKHSTDKANSGTGSLQVVTNGGGTSAGSLVGFANLDAEKQAGDKYVLTLYFNGGTGVTLSAGLVTQTTSVPSDAIVESCGGLGNSGTSPISCNVTGLTSGAWNKLSYVLTATEATTAAVIYARWCGGAYIDDVSLYKVEQVAPAEEIGDVVMVDGVEYTVNSANLVENGSFEDADGNLDVTGWLAQSTSANIPNPKTETADHFSAGSVYNYYYMGTEYALGAQYDRWGTKYTGPRRGNPTDGDWYLMTQWNDGFGGLCSIKRSFALESGKNYVMMYDIKSNSGNKTASNVYIGTTLAAGNGTAAGAITESWKTVSYFVEATDTVNTLWFNAYSMGNGICFDNFRLYEVELPAASTEASVAAALNKIELPASTKTDVTAMNGTTVNDGIGDFAVTWTSSNADVIADDGTYTSPEAITTVTVTPSTTLNGATVTGDAQSIVVIPASRAGSEYHGENGVYDIGTENIIAAAGTAASFEDAEGNQSLAGWKAHTGADTNAAINWADASVEIVPDGNWAYIGKWNDNITGTNYCTLDTMWAVTEGTYYLSFYAKKVAGGSATWVYFSEDNAHHTAVSQITSEAWVEAVSPTSDWVKYEYVIDATSDGYIGFTSHLIGNNGSNGTYFDDFELYSATQQAETLVSVPTVGATTTVIAGNAPILPATVAGTGSLGSDMPVAVVWDTTGLDFATAGTVTVPGTVTGTDFTTSATVAVLENKFSMDTVVAHAGQSTEAVHYFPIAVSGEATFEFDVVFNSLVNGTITLGDAESNGGNNPVFGGTGDAISIQTNSGGANIRAWSNGSAVSNVTYPVTTGATYRFLVTTNTDNDTWSATMTAADGTVTVVADNAGYRKTVDKIDSLTVLDNNGVADTITVSNFKVNANVSKTEYTFNITKDDETTSSTASFWTAEEAEASVADIEGYEKTVTVEGTTITVVYSATKTVTVSFETADGTVIHSVTEEVQLSESVTVNEAEIYDMVTCAYYVIPETVAAETTKVVVAPVENKYAVVADAFHNASDAQPWNDDANKLFVGSAGVSNADDTDANGGATFNGGSNVGSARVPLLKFNVPEVAENKAVKLHVYVAEINGNLGIGGTMKLAANVSTVEANETENAYVAGDLANLDGIVWSDTMATQGSTETRSGVYACDQWLEIDVTNFVKAATGDTITFALYAPTAGAYVADREKAVMGGTYQGKAAYLSVEDAFVVTATGAATLTKNGTAMTTAYATAADDVRLVAADAIVVGTDAGYYMANENLALTAATAFENTAPVGLGLAMVDGAQVRIGATELEEGAKLDALADSGLRFLATADYTDTVLADDAVEFGIKVSAEASDKVVYVKAENFQDADNTAFTAAITNLAESNYNRKYTATAYAKVTMADGSVEEFTAGEVTRSIYQVSAGIMKNGNAGEDAPYTVDGVVKNILNAYVNQTGIRLSYTADGIAVEEGKYTGDVFFTVTSVSDGDDGFNVTITPDTTWGTPAEIAQWWTDYVRFNNNNSVAKGYISGAEFADGVLTFNFDTTADNTGV
ncbi:MAG: Ig-like domain-containing protein [Clostridia bacterium]|nr:Ig-like domain-containing protein [Clostridia bacterium]